VSLRDAGISLGDGGISLRDAGISLGDAGISLEDPGMKLRGAAMKLIPAPLNARKAHFAAVAVVVESPETFLKPIAEPNLLRIREYVVLDAGANPLLGSGPKASVCQIAVQFEEDLPRAPGRE
jgi:hypothetical protein